MSFVEFVLPIVWRLYDDGRRSVARAVGLSVIAQVRALRQRALTGKTGNKLNCMGCGSVSKHERHGKGRTNSVEDSYSIRRQRVSVRIGSQVKRLDTSPNIIFIFGKTMDRLFMSAGLNWLGTLPVFQCKYWEDVLCGTRIAECGNLKRCILRNFTCGTFHKLHLGFFCILQNSNKIKQSISHSQA